MGPDFGPSWDQVPNSGPCRSPFKEKRTAALVTWATAAAGFPSSYSRIVLILDLGDHCHGRLGEEQEPEGKTNIKNRYKVLFIDTSLKYLKVNHGSAAVKFQKEPEDCLVSCHTLKLKNWHKSLLDPKFDLFQKVIGTKSWIRDLIGPRFRKILSHEKHCTAKLVTWTTAAAGFPSSNSRTFLILDLSDHCHGRLVEEQEPEG